MKIVEINSVYNGSTGKIMLGLADVARSDGMEVYCCATGTPSYIDQTIETYQIGGSYSRRAHAALSYLLGDPECHSSLSTKKLIRYIDSINPDIIHIHNIHGFFLNVKMLFSHIKKRNYAVVWTLHDCWAFTGRCPYFDILGCDSWKNGCANCRYPNDWYPKATRDISSKMWKRKKAWFNGINDLTIVTPSQWLAKLVKQSYLKDYPVRIINNGINIDVFKPTESDFRKKNHCENKVILLGVAFDWGERKGLDVINLLAERLPSKYQIVLVGTNDAIDQDLNKEIISIHRTHNQIELAEIYTAADLLINPTREDNFPTVNIEAIACGTPVITFNTGGSPEMLNSHVGSIVEYDDINAFEKAITESVENQTFSESECLLQAKKYRMDDKFRDYVELYHEIAGQ